MHGANNKSENNTLLIIKKQFVNGNDLLIKETRQKKTVICHFFISFA